MMTDEQFRVIRGLLVTWSSCWACGLDHRHPAGACVGIPVNRVSPADPEVRARRKTTMPFIRTSSGSITMKSWLRSRPL
jgi:hypothetical protein